MKCPMKQHAGKKKGEVVTFHEAIDWMLEQDDLSNIDGHYKLQSEYCNLHSHINDYTIIGRMEKDTLVSDPTCIRIIKYDKANDTLTDEDLNNNKFVVLVMSAEIDSDGELRRRLKRDSIIRKRAKAAKNTGF